MKTILNISDDIIKELVHLSGINNRMKLVKIALEEYLIKLQKGSMLSMRRNLVIDNNIDFGKLSAYGMWKDRTDIVDSIEYARKLRKKASRRSFNVND